MSKTELEISVSRDGEIETAIIDGPVDSATLDFLREKLDPVCNQPGAKVILDCRYLTYLNSRAIGLLVKYHRGLMLTQGRMALCGLNAKLIRTLDLLQLSKALSIYDSREKAQEAM